jgi:hypothetical protein
VFIERLARPRAEGEPPVARRKARPRYPRYPPGRGSVGYFSPRAGAISAHPIVDPPWQVTLFNHLVQLGPVLGLGTAWVLDGLSVTIASSVTSKLTQANTLGLSTAQAASIGTVYLVGEVIGALVFGRMSDSLGRGATSWPTTTGRLD